MNKRNATAAICLLLMLLSTLANAEMITIKPTFYDPANDIADWHRNRRDISDELIQELRKGSFAANFLPIDENLFLWYGTFKYHDLVQEESFWLGYDRDMHRTDAYAVAVDKEGKRLWSLRLSDPQSENGFSNARLLSDGRILLKFTDVVGEFGTQYYIVSREGEAQEILPAYKAKAYSVNEMLNPMHGGYFGGGMDFDSGAFGRMYHGANFTFFDKNMDIRWRNESEEFNTGFLEAYEMTDGILLGGTILKNYIPDQPYLHQTPQQAPIALKLDLEGNVVWKFEGHELSVTGLGLVQETEDGGVLFLTSHDPTVPTGYSDPEKATFVKLDRAGEIEWIRQIDEYDFYGLTGFVPYGAGYALSGYRHSEDDEMINIVLYVSKEGELISSALLDVGESSATYFYAHSLLVSATNGGAYLYGYTAEFESDQVGMDNPEYYKPFYADLRDVFPVE